MKPPELPLGYYLDHFLEMLSFVEKTYESVLDGHHHSFIQNFRGLPSDEQMLFVRLFNRRGRIFNRSQLNYGEISDVSAAVAGLRSRGYLRGLDEKDYRAWLSILTKDTLISLGKDAEAVKVKSSWTKPRLADSVIEAVPFARASKFIEYDAFVVLRKTGPIKFMLYLYFGKSKGDLKSFALRDLGVVRVNDANAFQARFTDAAEAKACFFYSQVLNSLTTSDPRQMAKAVQKLEEGPLNGGDYAGTLRHRAALEIGRFYEREKEPQRAIQIYRMVPSPGCNERLVRLLFNQSEKDEAKIILERMIDDPGDDDEHSFATDFYSRKYGGQRTGASTDLLRSGGQVLVDEIHRGNPEAGVASVYRRDGSKVYFAENILWRNLFGLLFWDELFESGQIHSGFDWLPQCIKDGRFTKIFGSQIEQKLSSIRRGSALPLVLKTIARQWGKPNGILSWRDIDPNALRDLLSNANNDAIAEIIGLMAQNYRATRDGFPDLMIELVPLCWTGWQRS